MRRNPFQTVVLDEAGLAERLVDSSPLFFALLGLWNRKAADVRNFPATWSH